MDFSEALKLIKDGKKVTRDGWNGKDMFIELQVPDVNSKMRRPYIFVSPQDRFLVPWVASQTDLLADDWRRVY